MNTLDFKEKIAEENDIDLTKAHKKTVQKRPVKIQEIKNESNKKSQGLKKTTIVKVK